MEISGCVQMKTPSSKIAIITGGSRGLGRSTVLSLTERGIDSIFTFNSNRAEAEKVVDLVHKMGRKAIALQLDTGNIGSFDLFVQGVRDALSELGADTSTSSSTTPGSRTISRSARSLRKSWMTCIMSTSKAYSF